LVRLSRLWAICGFIPRDEPNLRECHLTVVSHLQDSRFKIQDSGLSGGDGL